MVNYFAFLLRIWPGGSPEQPTWRAALENPHTRQMLAFSSIEALCGYLLTLASPPATENQPPSVGDIGYPPQDLPRQEDPPIKGN